MAHMENMNSSGGRDPDPPGSKHRIGHSTKVETSKDGPDLCLGDLQHSTFIIDKPDQMSVAEVDQAIIR